MMLMTKLDRLLTLDPLAGVPRRTIQLRSYPKSGYQNKNGAVDRQLCERVGAVMKNLWHRRRFNPSLPITFVQPEGGTAWVAREALLPVAMLVAGTHSAAKLHWSKLF